MSFVWLLRMLKNIMSDIFKETWIVGQPGGPSGPFYSVVSQSGRVVAMRIPERMIANTIASIPGWKETDEKLYNALIDIRNAIVLNDLKTAAKELNFWISIYRPANAED